MKITRVSPITKSAELIRFVCGGRRRQHNLRTWSPYVRVSSSLFLVTVLLSGLACVVSPTQTAPTPDIPATVEAAVREALAKAAPTEIPPPSPTAKTEGNILAGAGSSICDSNRCAKGD